MVKTLLFSVGSADSIPSQGTQTPHVSGPKIQNIKQKHYYNRFSKDFKTDPHFKKSFLIINK